MATWDDVYAQLGITKYDATFWRRLNGREIQPVVRMRRKEFIMGIIAWESGRLENAGWDRWELHALAVNDAYDTGSARVPLALHHGTRWHRAILPFGGCLRTSNPVSVGMGESFRPAPWHKLPMLFYEFISAYSSRLDANDPFYSMAQLHFEQWQTHFWADANKRHCRLLTTYGCGWLGIDPVCITLAVKDAYLDALAEADIDGLAALFAACQIQL
jgi:hypothetical protein